MTPTSACDRLWSSCLGLGMAIGCAVTPAVAQSTAQPLKDLNPNSSDNLTDVVNNPSVGGASLLQLMNRIQLLDGRTAAEFAADQDENINTAVTEFLQKQQKQIQTSPLTPASELQ